ncbi:hypothetical protein T484DRAFT_1762043 [Baffinella frigidus]|nr:hypothetical protein T484DRAFT_1762043 [Cryptophyta sp. CCMP2293]
MGDKGFKEAAARGNVRNGLKVQELSVHQEATALKDWGDCEVKMLQMFGSIEAAVHADGVEAYVTECTRLGALPQPQVTIPMSTVPLPQVWTRLLTRSPLFQLRAFSLPHPVNETVAAALDQVMYLDGVDLHSAALNDEALPPLVAALVGCEITTLDLSCNPLGGRGNVKEHGGCVLRKKQVEAANTSTRHNRFDNSDRLTQQAREVGPAIKSLTELLCTLGKLVTLTLVSTGINDADVKVLANGMRQNFSLVRIDLSKNSIGDRGAESLAGMLSHCETVRWAATKRRIRKVRDDDERREAAKRAEDLSLGLIDNSGERLTRLADGKPPVARTSGKSTGVSFIPGRTSSSGEIRGDQAGPSIMLWATGGTSRKLLAAKETLGERLYDLDAMLDMTVDQAVKILDEVVKVGQDKEGMDPEDRDKEVAIP